MAKRGRKKKKQQVNINVVVAVMIIASILFDFPVPAIRKAKLV